MTTSKDKGKGRAVDERTPLLDSGESSAGPSTRVGEEVPSRPRWTKWMLASSLATLTLCFIAIITLILLAGFSYAEPATHTAPQALIQQAVVFRGPSHVDITNVTSDSLLLNVEGAIGINADVLLGLNQQQGGRLSRPRTAFGRWLVRRLASVTVSLSTISIYAPYSRTIHAVPSTPLFEIQPPTFSLPLSVNPPDDDTWLSPLSLSILVHPAQSNNALLSYAEDALKMRRALVTIEIKSVRVFGQGSWRSLFSVQRNDLRTVVKYEFPPLGPNAPSNVPISELISLNSYSLYPIPPTTIGLSVEASIYNPLPPSIRGRFQHPLSFTASLLSQLPTDSNSPSVPLQAAIARVQNGPISLTHPNITLALDGHILPLSPSALPLLSQFLSNYLSGKSSPILVSSEAPFKASLRTVFPGPVPKPQVIKHVTIRNMKIYPDGNGTALLTSGIIIVDIALPDALKNINVNVESLLPDVLVFDGAPSNLSEAADIEATIHDSHHHLWPHPRLPSLTKPAFPAPPLPSPLPDGAFARIRPTSWLNATSVPAPIGSPAGVTTIVTAILSDVPLQILSGRDKVFSAFVSKVVFKGSAEAGVRGDAAVGARIDGLVLSKDSEMELKGLPVEGLFMIHRGDVLKLPRIGWLPGQKR